MKSVFQASTSVEAYMIKNLLEVEGLDAEVFGEHLQGGVGDLQAIGLVRVMVADEDYSCASEIIFDWEKNQPEAEVVDMPKRTSGFGYGLLGFILGVAAVLLFLTTPISKQGIDYDKDGNIDESWLYAGGVLRKVEFDRNNDQVVDVVWRYDIEGLLKTSLHDQNFDGEFDGKCRYKHGLTLECKWDFDQDYFSEVVIHHVNDLPTTTTIYNPETKAVKKIERYSHVGLQSAELDSDDDGQLDTKINYDAYGEIVSKLALN